MSTLPRMCVVICNDNYAAVEQAAAWFAHFYGQELALFQQYLPRPGMRATQWLATQRVATPACGP